MLLMGENGIRDGMCQTIHRYAKANNKYMKNYNKNIEPSHLMHLGTNNLYGWAMSQKLPVNGLQWVEDESQLKEDFITNYDDNNDVGYFLEIDIQYSKKISNLHKDLLFLPERKKVKKCNKRVCNIQDKENYVIHIKAFKKSTKSWIKTEKSAQSN